MSQQLALKRFAYDNTARVTAADLPAVDTTRWSAQKKAAIVASVRQGIITMQEACRRYKLSVEEFLSWQKSVDKHGLPGLRTTRVQYYRDFGNPDLRLSPAVAHLDVIPGGVR